MGSVGSRTAQLKVWFDRLEQRRVPGQMRERWRVSTSPENTDDSNRLNRDRVVVVPWLAATRRLSSVRVLEIGCGAGLSAVALAEQGATVVGLDVEASAVEAARRRMSQYGLEACFVTGNAASLAEAFVPEQFDWIMFWAALEHMTLDERLHSLTAAWELLPSGGLLTVIETPNRLWFFDSHTSRLPFYMWLPDELAYRTAHDSDRVGFGDQYSDAELANFDSFLRRGRGVSYHEFDVAIGKECQSNIVSCLQLDRRRRSVVRRVAWRFSRAGRYERILATAAPALPKPFLQPLLYLTFRKP